MIRARLDGDTSAAPFRYFDKGGMAMFGRMRAVAHSAKMNFVGFPAFVVWAFIDVLYLIGWGNRLGTLYTWAARSGSRMTGRTGSSRSIRPATR